MKTKATAVLVPVALCIASMLAGPSADASPTPHFTFHAHRVLKGQYAGETRYEVQSSEHWAHDRVWLQVWVPSEKACNPRAKFTSLHRWVTLYKKTADANGHVSYWINALKPCGTRFLERFWSPPAPGYAAEKSATFHPRMRKQR